MRTFYHLLGNTILATVTNMTVWFALTFFVYLETHSVFATAIVSGLYLVAAAASGFWFGSLVDRYRKKQVMLGSSVLSLLIYIAGFALLQLSPPEVFKDPTSPRLWVFVPLLMAGVIVGNIRGIALSTIIPMLFAAEERDKANGMAGTASGVAFMVVSVISGFMVAQFGMQGPLVLAITVTLLTILHLWWIPLVEREVAASAHEGGTIDISGTITIIKAIPGLFPLIFFTTFNNFLGGVFMALMDAYGLSLVSVQVWGLLWGLLSCGFIVGGVIIARWGLGANPLRTMFVTNIVLWTITIFFTIQPSIILFTAGMFIYLCLMPYIEAAEQTIIQRVVPHERQGRVFGFAQSVETAASPLTAFLIGPIAQFIFIPFMTTGAGVRLIGDWYGSGSDRGIALLFSVAGVIGLCVTVAAMRTPYYRLLSHFYRTAPDLAAAPAHPVHAQNPEPASTLQEMVS